MLGGQRIPLTKQETAIWLPGATATASVGVMVITTANQSVKKNASYTPIASNNASYIPIVSKSGRAG